MRQAAGFFCGCSRVWLLGGRSWPSVGKPSLSLAFVSLAQVQLSRGDKYTLKDNSNPETWVVQSSTGVVQEAPSACFSIPPPDPESIDKVNR